jgi:hypothetical protein
MIYPHTKFHIDPSVQQFSPTNGGLNKKKILEPPFCCISLRRKLTHQNLHILPRSLISVKFLYHGASVASASDIRRSAMLLLFIVLNLELTLKLKLR